MSDAPAIADLAERAAVYALLSRLWAAEVDNALLAALESGDLRLAYESAGGRLAVGESLEDLQQDYCRLFIGPQGHMPPVQSVWQEGRFQGDAADSLRQYLDILGITVFEADPRPPDHAANILDMFSRVLTSVTESPELQAEPDLGELMASFFEAHVGWIADLAEAAEKRAATSFYQGVMSVTRGFLTAEGRALG